MKIIYLVHQFYPEWYTGTEKVVYKLSSMMQRAGHSVRVIAYSFYPDSFYDRQCGDILLREFSYRGVPLTALRHKRIPENINFVFEDTKLRKVTEEILGAEKPDIVHVGHPMRMVEFVSAAERMNIPYILTLTDYWLICQKVILLRAQGDLCRGQGGEEACRRFCPDLHAGTFSGRHDRARALLTTARKIVAPSHFLRDIFVDALGPMDISVINHGLSYGIITANVKRYQKDDAVVFCYAGSLTEHKGVHVLIRAFMQVSSPRIRLKIHGSGTNVPYIKMLHTESATDKRIEFCGVYDEEDLGRVLSAVDVIALPSMWFESYSLVLHEALASRVPVVSSDLGIMAEKIRDGVNGFLFPLGDVEGLKAVIEKIADNPELLNGIKENIKDLVIPSIEQEAHAYQALYAQMKDG